MNEIIEKTSQLVKEVLDEQVGECEGDEKPENEEIPDQNAGEKSGEE